MDFLCSRENILSEMLSSCDLSVVGLRSSVLGKINYYIGMKVSTFLSHTNILCTQNVFKTFLSKVPVHDRYTTLFKQYNSLIQQELPSSNDYGVLAELLVPLWVNYNLREQLELLHVLILLVSQINVTLDNIEHLVNLLQVRSFI